MHKRGGRARAFPQALDDGVLVHCQVQRQADLAGFVQALRVVEIADPRTLRTVVRAVWCGLAGEHDPVAARDRLPYRRPVPQLSPSRSPQVTPGGPPSPRPAARVQPSDGSAAPSQPWSRRAPERPVASRSRACTPGCGMSVGGGRSDAAEGLQRLRSRGASAKMPFEFPIRCIS